jgi:hypothetical protein
MFAQNFQNDRFLSGGVPLFQQPPGFLGLGALGVLLYEFLQGNLEIRFLVGLLVRVSLAQEGRRGQDAIGVLQHHLVKFHPGFRKFLFLVKAVPYIIAGLRRFRAARLALEILSELLPGGLVVLGLIEA